MKWIVLFSLLAAGNISFAEDFSGLFFRLQPQGKDGLSGAAGYAHLMVTDPLGRKTGYDPAAREEIKQIPRSGYIQKSAPGGKAGIPEVKNISLNISPAISSGAYNVAVIGASSVRYKLKVTADGYNGGESLNQEILGYTASGARVEYVLKYDPAPGSPSPEIKKTVSFEALCNEVLAAQKLGYIGDAKFSGSLVKQIKLAEKLSKNCGELNNSEGGCGPADAVLNLLVKRLELANRKCDAKQPRECDEEPYWAEFRTKQSGENAFKAFFHEWDLSDWQKVKKTVKRLLSDEALKIIKADSEALLTRKPPAVGALAAQ